MFGGQRRIKGDEFRGSKSPAPANEIEYGESVPRGIGALGSKPKNRRRISRLRHLQFKLVVGRARLVECRSGINIHFETCVSQVVHFTFQ